jgi:hypothetical protein
VLNRLIAPAGLSPALTPASRAHQAAFLDQSGLAIGKFRRSNPITLARLTIAIFSPSKFSHKPIDTQARALPATTLKKSTEKITLPTAPFLPPRWIYAQHHPSSPPGTSHLFQRPFRKPPPLRHLFPPLHPFPPMTRNGKIAIMTGNNDWGQISTFNIPLHLTIRRVAAYCESIVFQCFGHQIFIPEMMRRVNLFVVC